VPGDVSVVGFDDLPVAGWEIVQLTTVQQPMAAMARAAGRLLVERIEGRADPHRVQRSVFEPKIVLRATLGPPRQADACPPHER
jgi:LacI family transcriptional regulator